MSQGLNLKIFFLPLLLGILPLGCKPSITSKPQSPPTIALGKYQATLRTENQDSVLTSQIELEFLQNNTLIQRIGIGQHAVEEIHRWKQQGKTLQLLNVDRKERLFIIKESKNGLMLIDRPDTIFLEKK